MASSSTSIKYRNLEDVIYENEPGYKASKCVRYKLSQAHRYTPSMQHTTNLKTLTSTSQSISNFNSTMSQKKLNAYIEDSKSLMTKYLGDITNEMAMSAKQLKIKGKQPYRKKKQYASGILLTYDKTNFTADTNDESTKKQETTNNNENDKYKVMKTNNAAFITEPKKQTISFALPSITVNTHTVTNNTNTVTSSTNYILETSSSRSPIVNPHQMRIRTYQPYVDLNWKFKSGLTSSIKSSNAYSPVLMNNIDYQRKIIDEQVRLLFENILHFKQSVIYQKNFTEAFTYMTYKCQVSLNKALEEVIGILYIVPQMILSEFFVFVENLSNVKVPHKSKLNNKLITNEENCFHYNNSLLTEIMDFFKGCQEVYVTMCNEIDQMVLKSKKFENVVCLLEKARYDISNVIMRANNAVIHYNTDLALIEKMRKAQGEEPLFAGEKESLEDKMRNQFIFKKNEERQRVVRIKNALKNQYEDIEKDISNKYANVHRTSPDDFQSIIVSLLFNLI